MITSIFSPFERPLVLDYRNPISNLKNSSASEVLNHIKSSNSHFARAMPQNYHQSSLELTSKLGIDETKLMSQLNEFRKKVESKKDTTKISKRQVSDIQIKMGDLNSFLHEKMNKKVLMYQAQMLLNTGTNKLAEVRQTVRKRKIQPATSSSSYFGTEQQQDKKSMYLSIFKQVLNEAAEIGEREHSDRSSRFTNQLRRIITLVRRSFPENPIWKILEAQLFEEAGLNIKDRDRTHAIMMNTVRLLECRFNAKHIPNSIHELTAEKIAITLGMDPDRFQDEGNWYKKYLLFRAGRFHDIIRSEPETSFTQDLREYLEGSPFQPTGKFIRFDSRNWVYDQTRDGPSPAMQQISHIMNRKCIADDNIIQTPQDFIWTALLTCETSPDAKNDCDFHVSEIKDYVSGIYSNSKQQKDPSILAFGLNFKALAAELESEEQVILNLILGNYELVPETLTCSGEELRQKYRTKQLQQHSELLNYLESYCRKQNNLEAIVATLLLFPHSKAKLKSIAKLVTEKNMVEQFFGLGQPTRQTAAYIKIWTNANSHISPREDRSSQASYYDDDSAAPSVPQRNNTDSYNYLIHEILSNCKQQGKNSETLFALSKVLYELGQDKEANSVLVKLLLNSLVDTVPKQVLEYAINKLKVYVQSSTEKETEDVQIILKYVSLYKQLHLLTTARTAEYEPAKKCQNALLYPLNSNSYSETEQRLDEKLWKILANQDYLPSYCRFMKYALFCEQVLQLYERNKPASAVREMGFKRLQNMWSRYESWKKIEWEPQIIKDLQNYFR